MEQPTRRDVVGVVIIWAVITVLVLLLAQVELFPPATSDKGEIIDDAFNTLLLLSAPVFGFVVAVLLYSVFRFRRTGDPTEDGPPNKGRSGPRVWLVVTSALAVLVMIYPGLVELPRVIAIDPEPDLVVEVESFRWAWRLTYPASGVQTGEELVLPVDRTVRFDITSLDILHSFWVPAFRMKIDAVPGITTQISLTPTALGSYEESQMLRLQCAELCGIGHPIMAMPVRVVTEQEFSDWVDTQLGSAS